MTTNTILEVNRAAVGESRLTEAELPSLAAGQVRLRIERFAVTANNITYASFGNRLGYWDFFPTGELEWGRVPAMGWAEIVESNHPDIPTGDRYYGWYPMAAYVDLTASPTGTGLRDDGPHRLANAAVYRAFVDTKRDPLYPATADALADAEDRHALLRGLFATAFLADEFFADADFFGADGAVVLSASSKTAIGLAQRLASRRRIEVIGLTSAANADFVQSLGWYDRVVSYDDLSTLAGFDAVAVDMSGNAAVLGALHDQLGDHLKYSMVIGKSHHDAPRVEVTTGPTPELFFAPTEMARREDEWGAVKYRERLAAAMNDFIEGSNQWLTVQRDDGPDATQMTWADVYDGAVPPHIGRIVSMQEAYNARGPMMQISRVGDFNLGWGESLLWDDRRERLYFVDCATQCLHWLENAAGELQTFQMTSMPAGVVPTEDGRLVAALDDGLYVVDPDARIVDRLSPYPDGLGARANDACADLSGNLITGTLNLAPSEGSSWQYSLTHGWRLLDPDITNTNGPTAFDVDGRSRLVIGDTAAQYFVYDYDADAGTVGPRAVFGDVTAIDGSPDGATLDADGGLWCALFGGAQLARFTIDGLDRTLPVPAANPTDVTFAGPALDRLYVTSIGGEGEMDGALLVIDGLATTGRVEPRFAF